VQLPEKSTACYLFNAKYGGYAMTTSRSKTGSNRLFGIIIGLALIFIAGWKFLTDAWSYPIWASMGGLFLLVALLVPRLLRPIKTLWLGLGHILGRVLSPIFLTIIYASSIIPIGFLLKVFRKDTLHLARDPKRDSYWILRKPPGPAPATLKNQF
jgi:hypothetical protein